MLQGEYRHNIDDKGRLQIPARFKEELGEEFVLCRGVARGNGRCLWAFTMEGWESFTAKIGSMSFSDAQDFKRFFINKSELCGKDNQGRMLIPQFLRQFKLLIQAMSFSSKMRRLFLSRFTFGTRP